ncbi:MAG: hypothetical protein RL499_1721 [Actinomycetota bacterium]
MSKKTTLRDIEQLLDVIDLDDYPVDDPADLRRIGLAAKDVERAKTELAEAVAAARTNGRSWGFIGLVLGISKQAAQQRFGEPAAS